MRIAALTINGPSQRSGHRLRLLDWLERVQGNPGHTFGFTSEKPEGNSRPHLAIASNGLAERLISAKADMDAIIREQAGPLVVQFSDPNR
jgi:hypothetical protein